MEQELKGWRDSICNPPARFPSRPATLSDDDVELVADVAVVILLLWVFGAFDRIAKVTP